MSEIATTVTMPHRACSHLVIEGLGDNTFHRVVLASGTGGHVPRSGDGEPLDDAFSRLVLSASVFPSTAGEVLKAILEAVPPNDPLATHRFFLVGEGGQVPATGQPVNRNLRFLVSCGRGPHGADLFMSSFHPDQGIVEIMAWDDTAGGFNFYRTMPDSSAWVFAGNSRHALMEPTRDNGPFESHRNGHFLMKELKVPWVHWHSPFALISPSSLIAQGLDSHPWVSLLEPGGAYTLEDDIAKPAVARWTRVRVEAAGSGRRLETPKRVMEQLLDTLTINLVSSLSSSAGALSSSDPVGLPTTYFVDDDSFRVLGLSAAPTFSVSADIYASSLATFDCRLDDDGGFVQAGDTHFAFVVPERSHEDVVTLSQFVQSGMLTPRLMACLLMVDFPNPVFSDRRRALVTYVLDEEFDKDGSALAESVVDAIRNSNESSVPSSPESEFLELWDVGESFTDEFDSRLSAYYDAVEVQLRSQSGFDDYIRLAESRRSRVLEMPIAESALLFARTNVPAATRIMTTTGAVREV